MRSKELVLVSASLGMVLAALLACKQKKDDGSGSATTTSADPATGATTVTPAGEPPPGDKPGKGCVLPNEIHANFTVTKGCTTHLKGALNVYDEATLTIEAGVKILAETDAYLWVDKGKLLVKGTAAEPVTFTSANTTKAPGDWVGIGFREGVMSGTSIEHAIIEYAGSKNNGGVAAIKLDSMRQGKRISITDTNITLSGQFGITTDDNGSFAVFENNQLTGNKSGSLNTTGEVLGSIGKGNKFVDPIHVKETQMDETTTWPAFDVPVIVDGNINIGSDTAIPILTIADKTTVKVGSNLYFWVASRGAGAIVAKNVTFTSASPSPSQGDWVGILIGAKANGTNLDGCTFEYGGGRSQGGMGVITFYGVDAKGSKGVKVQNSTFKNIDTGAFGSGDHDCGDFLKAGNKVEGTDPLCTKP
jgi:hypothetical protein